jgi:hypothetical protein
MAEEKIKMRARPQDWKESDEGHPAARGDEPESNPEPTAPPAGSYKILISLWDQQYEVVSDETGETERKFTRFEVLAKFHNCTVGALTWEDAETGGEHGIPWWRIAAFEAEPRPNPKPWAESGPVWRFCTLPGEPSPWEPGYSGATIRGKDSDAVECEGKECPYCEGTGREGASQ